MDQRSEQGLTGTERRARIRQLLERRPYVAVTDLSDRFGVSDVTVRADLERLEDEGALDRVRGGAVGTRAAVERTFAHQLGAHAEEKAAIGRAAGDLLRDSESLFIDSGTTTTAFARNLVEQLEPSSGMVVITNSLPVALELEDGIPPLQVVITGGTLRPLQHSLVEPLAMSVADQLRVDTTILGCTGIDPVAGVTNVNVPEVTVKQRWHQQANRTIVVADGSKVGVTTLARVCPITEVDVLVTGESAPADVVATMRKLGVTVIVAEGDAT